MSKILVTGAAGFIGSNLVDTLIQIGHTVIAIDNESATANSQFYWNDEADNHKLDVTDFESILPLFEDVDYVFHMAAEARVQTSIEGPLRSISTNVLGTSNVLEASKIHKVRRVIYSMTSSVYGSHPSPHVESMEPRCLSPYAVSKLAGEQLCGVYSDLYDLDTTSLRYFNVYGPREPSKGPYSSVIGKFITQRKNNDFLTIVGDGEQRRDFTHVADVINANIYAMDYRGRLSGDIFNIGASDNFSINEVASAVSNKYVFISERPGEARETLADTSKAKQMLNWTPRESLLSYIEGSLAQLT